MSNDPTVRRILPHDAQDPQSAQMSSFAFQPQQFPQRETQRNFVFVDEHNRHKRLKVMRACEGCRRRKIKCDAATTNAWPCSACIRLKLHCVRPNANDGSPDGLGYDASLDPTGQFQPIGMDAHLIQGVAHAGPSAYPAQQTFSGGDPNISPYQNLAYDAPQTQQNAEYSTLPLAGSLADHGYGPPPQYPPASMPQQGRAESSPEAYSPDVYQQQDLADLLGGLKVDAAGTAPYLRHKASFKHEEPAVEDDDEYQTALPPLPSGRGLKIRIPPELMPDDETALRCFDFFFTHAHAYVPVLNKQAFYNQWHTERATISPLLLEAIFAIGGRLAEEPGEGHQWLALAARHADSFMDVPRMSTLQALLMILKARESAPKRGYYYRSWMMIVQCVEMGKDLGLDEHFEDHQAGKSCGFSVAECQLRTRIWQTIFVCEVMIGGPQGRTDLAVTLDSVDFNVPQPINGTDDFEYQTSRNFTYFARIVRNVKKMNRAYGRVKRKKEWGIDPKFQQTSQDVHAFIDELPPDLSINFPPDGSPPWLPSHFLGNLISYYYLTLILHHRPILSFLDPNGGDGQWKKHMLICYQSAKHLCRLQEAIINTFGLAGLQSMQRGYSFTVYSGLSCVVLHLVAIVSPDPELNEDARQYFTRHMRIMEQVMDVWQMPELQKQIDTIRVAFSADTRKPFALKPSFPYGSPHPSSSSGSPRGAQGFRPPTERVAVPAVDTQAAQQLMYANHPVSPPISAGAADSKNHSPGVPTSMAMMSPTGTGAGMHQGMPMAAQPVWNPNRIFEQWNSTFGTPIRSEPTPDPDPQMKSLNVCSPAGVTEVPADVPAQDIQAMNPPIPAGSHVPTQAYPSTATPTLPNFVTPAMWQESVASVYEGGLKRSWDYQGGPIMKR